jgi:hypothetical protein
MHHLLAINARLTDMLLNSWKSCPYSVGVILSVGKAAFWTEICGSALWEVCVMIPGNNHKILCKT